MGVRIIRLWSWDYGFGFGIWGLGFRVKILCLRLGVYGDTRK